MDPKEESLYRAVLLIGGILSIIGGYFIISLIRQHKKNLRLYKQSIGIEINTLEKERTRMAADLHDEIGPVLSAIKLKMNSFDINNEEDEKELERTNEQIDQLMKRMREISFDLMPSSLLRKGLTSAVNEFIEYISRKSKLEIIFQYVDLEIDQMVSINLYRIIQEIIHNTLKHAGATLLKIDIKISKNMILLQTQDNGIGFDYSNKTKEYSGLGLRNLLTRIENIGGKMYYESYNGSGTSYIFELPITNNAKSKAN